jgi:hypothetical protein
MVTDNFSLNGTGEGNPNVVFTNWNLDSDRGYGYKTWSGKLTAPNLAIAEGWIYFGVR